MTVLKKDTKDNTFDLPLAMSWSQIVPRVVSSLPLHLILGSTVGADCYLGFRDSCLEVGAQCAMVMWKEHLEKHQLSRKRRPPPCFAEGRSSKVTQGHSVDSSASGSAAFTVIHGLLCQYGLPPSPSWKKGCLPQLCPFSCPFTSCFTSLLS